MRHQIFCFRLTQALFDCALYTNQTCAELVFSQLTNATYTTISEVVDIIDLSATVTQLNQHFDRFENILVGQSHGSGNVVATAQTAIHFHATYAG